MIQTIQRYILAAITLILASSYAMPQAINNEEARDKVFAELKPYQHKFISKELDLSREQANEFFPIYDKMDEELRQVNTECRELERSALDNKDASETELEAVAAVLYAQKQKESAIEQAYYDKFKEILTPRQLIILKVTERRFTQKLLRHHRRISHKAMNAADTTEK